MDTKKLYYEDAYRMQFCAQVLSCTPASHGNFHVVLDQTAFYPEGGGQPADCGSLGGACVLDVHERDGVIVHTTASPLRVGETVQGDIDSIRRLDHMQQHTGEHILSGLVRAQFGYSNVGFRMGKDVVTVDFSGPLTSQDLAQLEEAANWVVWQNGTVEASFPTPEQLEKLDYRSKKEIAGAVRIVRVANVDLCACCGTHVARCAEVGLIKLLSAQAYKGGTRVTLVCGMRALADYTVKWRNAETISNLLSAKPNEIDTAVQRLLDENVALKARRGRLEEALFSARAEAMAGQSNPLLFEDDLSPDGLRRLSTALSAVCPGVCAVFSGQDSTYHYALCSATQDVRPLGAALNSALNGRGGGQAALVQGTVCATREAIEAYFSAQ
jgi:alanyl-tRNA synthetase